jgi:hypothetical protein
MSFEYTCETSNEIATPELAQESCVIHLPREQALYPRYSAQRSRKALLACGVFAGIRARNTTGFAYPHSTSMLDGLRANLN